MKKTLLALGLLTSLPLAAADVNIAYAADFTSLDPMERLSDRNLQMAHLLFDPLLRRDHEGQLVPRLAEKWTKLNDTTYRFELHKNVKFHSGNPFTADDVVWSFNRSKTSPEYAPLFSHFDKFVKIDDHTVELRLKDKDPLALMVLPNLFIMDSKFYESSADRGKIDPSGDNFADTNVSGTGPFSLESRQRERRTVLKKNPSYWTSSGNVDTLTINIEKDDELRLNNFLSGKVDYITPVSPKNIERVQKSDNRTVLIAPSEKIIMLQLNQQVTPQFQDKRVRQAVNLTINRKDIGRRVLAKLGTPADQLSPAGYLGHLDNHEPAYDLARAKALMAEAKLAEGFETKLIAPRGYYVYDDLIAQGIATQLKNINIRVETEVMPASDFWPRFERCDAGMAFIGWVSDTGDSANLSEYLTATRDRAAGRGVMNCGGFSNRIIDEALKAVATEDDPAKRRELLQRIAQTETDEALIIPLHWQNLSYGYPKSWSNFASITHHHDYPYFGDLVIKE